MFYFLVDVFFRVCLFSSLSVGCLPIKQSYTENISGDFFSLSSFWFRFFFSVHSFWTDFFSCTRLFLSTILKRIVKHELDTEQSYTRPQNINLPQVRYNDVWIPISSDTTSPKNWEGESERNKESIESMNFLSDIIHHMQQNCDYSRDRSENTQKLCR